MKPEVLIHTAGRTGVNHAREHPNLQLALRSGGSTDESRGKSDRFTAQRLASALVDRPR